MLILPVNKPNISGGTHTSKPSTVKEITIITLNLLNAIYIIRTGGNGRYKYISI